MRCAGPLNIPRSPHNELVEPLVGLSTMSSHMNYDFAQLPLDEPLSDISVQGMQGMLAAVRNLAGTASPTLREIGRRYGESVIVPQVAGTAVDIADQLEAWFLDEAADGFMVSAAHLPDGFEDFVSGVVPQLQRRGSSGRTTAAERCAKTCRIVDIAAAECTRSSKSMRVIHRRYKQSAIHSFR